TGGIIAGGAGQPLARLVEADLEPVRREHFSERGARAVGSGDVGPPGPKQPGQAGHAAPPDADHVNARPLKPEGLMARRAGGVGNRRNGSRGGGAGGRGGHGAEDIGGGASES